MAAGGDFTIITTERVTGADKREVTAVSLDAVEWDIRDVNKLKLSVDPLSRNADSILIAEREVQLWIDQDWVWCGIPWEVDGDFGKLTFDCEDLFSYFQSRSILDDDLIYEDLDQLTIARNLVTYAQSAAQGTNPGLGIGIAEYANSGITRSKEYISDRKQNIFDALNEFASLEDGFEQSIELEPSGARLWKPWFPKKGTDRTDIVLEFGRNIVGGKFKESAKRMATLVDTTGGTSSGDPFNPLAGREKQHFKFEDAAAALRYGSHVAVVPSGSRSDMQWLESRSKSEVAMRANPIVTPTVTCRQGGRYPVLIGNVREGDTVRVKIDHGRIQVNGTFRIKTLGWIPGNNLVPITFTDVLEST